MITMLNFFYPTYYASLEMASHIVFVFLECYLYKIHPNRNNNRYWLPTCNSYDDTKFKHKILDLLFVKLFDALKKKILKYLQKITNGVLY